jgi:hypothetical protein
MKNLGIKRVILSALLVMVCFTSCVGPFNAGRRIHTWNREIENRWVGEGVFLVFRFVFVYSAAFVGDILIFNSIEFWGGTNPIDPPSKDRIQALKDADDARAAGEDDMKDEEASD